MKKIKAFFKANDFPLITFIRYWKYSSRSELIVDVFFPVLLSFFMIGYSYSFVTSLGEFIEKFQNMSGQVIAALSILAGFNITSITVLASANSSAFNMLKGKKSRDEKLDLYEMLICFFTWAVIIQLLVVLISIIVYYVGSFVPREVKNSQVPIVLWIGAFIWLTSILHSVLVSLRNMKTLYYYVVYKPKQTSNSNIENKSELGLRNK